MTRRLPPTALVVALAAVVAVVCGWLAAPPAAADTSPGASRSAGLVVVGVGTLAWQQVSPGATPALWGMTRDGSAAALTVKTPGPRTCGLDAWATVSAGEGTALADAAGPCPTLPDLELVAGSGTVRGFATLSERAGAAAYSARLGLLGDAMDRAGVCARAAGPGAGLALANEQGEVAQYVQQVPPGEGTELAELLSTCRLTVLDLTHVGGEVGTPASTAASMIDDRVAQVLRAVPPTSDVLVVSLAGRASGSGQGLQVLVGTGPSFPPGTFRSPSTRIDGLAQLSDVTATVVSLTGASAVSTGGGVLSTTVTDNNSESTATAKRAALIDHDQLSLAMTRVAAPFLTVWLAALLLTLLACHAVASRASLPRARRARARAVARRTALVGACMPAATFLANLLPWWRVSGRLAWQVTLLLLTVAAICAALAWVCARGPWRRSAVAVMAAVCGVTLLVIGGDLVLGSRLQTASVFGLQPLVGGRFYGMGNVAFALYASATLMLAAGVAALVQRRAAGRSAAVRAGAVRAGAVRAGTVRPGSVRAALAVAAIGAVALGVDIAPAWGADFGGPLALAPALAYLAVRASGGRMRPATALGAAAAGVLIVALVAWLDWRRPEASRTHLGRFVQTVLDGQAWPVVWRKLEQNLATLMGQPILLVAAVVLLGPMVAAIIRPGLLRTHAWARLARDEPMVRHGLVAVLVMLLIAFLTNDTGAAIPPTAAMMLFPLLVATVLHHDRRDAAAPSAPREGARLSDPDVDATVEH